MGPRARPMTERKSRLALYSLERVSPAICVAVTPHGFDPERGAVASSVRAQAPRH
jgi:hypothetical protein